MISLAWPAMHRDAAPLPAAMVDPDADEVRAAAGGDLDAASRLYARHRTRLLNLSRLLTGNAGDAEDVCHEAFLRALTHLSGFRGEVPFVAWLSRIAVNVSRNLHGRAQTRRQFLALAQDSAGPAIAARSSAELQAALQQAVKRLSAGQREVFVCHDVLGMQHDEIAYALGCAEGTSKVQLHKARLRLRSILSGEEG
jgi:RNA polymerase sigma-70 factor, ECF subfamily